MIISTDTLEQTLSVLAEAFHLDANALMAYAAKDTLTGWDFDKGDWPCGSLHRPEGQTLYALIRALQPEHIVEFGTLYGCSASHLQAAIEINGKGKVDSVDPIVLNGRRETAGVNYIQTDALRYIEGNHALEFVFEDTDHHVETTRDIWTAALEKLKPGGIIISHDAFHEWAGKMVREGITIALGHDDFICVQVPPSDCGLAVYRRPLLR